MTKIPVYIKVIFCTRPRCVVIGAISFFTIYILEFTQWRIGTSTNADAVNNTIEALAFGILSASIFYFLNDLLPAIQRIRVARNSISILFFEIHENLRRIIESIDPSHFQPYNKGVFVAAFAKRDLYDAYFMGNAKIIDVLEQRKERVISICCNLLSSYFEYLSYSELKCVNDMMQSCFIRDMIVPMDFSIPEEFYDTFPNNQEEIGISIYELYAMTKARLSR